MIDDVQAMIDDSAQEDRSGRPLRKTERIKMDHISQNEIYQYENCMCELNNEIWFDLLKVRGYVRMLWLACNMKIDRMITYTADSRRSQCS